MIRNMNTIKLLIEKEYENAVIEHGNSPSVGDAISLFREEIEETTEEFNTICDFFEYIWNMYRVDNYNEIVEYSEKLIEKCQHLICEAIQAGAMAKKMSVIANTEKVLQDIKDNNTK